MAWNDNLIEGTPSHILASTDSPVIRAVAGPGSGKSFAIQRRVARLLEAGVDPEKILAITFTRTAAQDLKKEIGSLKIEGADRVHARTLHSHALQMLMRKDVLERTQRVPRMILDHEIVPGLMDIHSYDYKGKTNRKDLLSAFKAAWAQMQQDEPGYAQNKEQRHFQEDILGWMSYHKGMIISEVVPIATQYLTRNPAAPEIGKYDYILVDEYQDLNKSEQEFICRIKGDATVVLVGDDDQSIYSFKHAHPEGIRQVDTLYGKYLDVPFSECRRCPQTVTKIASDLIAHNQNRTLGQLIPHPHNDNGIVDIVQWTTYDDEIEYLSELIAHEIKAGLVKPEEVLVLTPRRRVGYKLRDQLLRHGIPVKSYFRESAIENTEVQKAYSELYLLYNPEDMISLRFLLGESMSKQYEIVRLYADDHGISIMATLHKLVTEEIRLSGVSHITKRYNEIRDRQEALRSNFLENSREAVEKMYIHTEEDQIDFYELNQVYQSALEESGELNLEEENFEVWFKRIFEELQDKLILPEPPSDLDHVRIMSMHASKGLSAKFVVMASMIDHLVPYLPAKLTDTDKARAVEESRRLFYVAMTRCKATKEYPGRLIISSFLSINGTDALRMGIKAHAGYQLEVDSSRFINELGKNSPAPIRGDILIKMIREA